MNGTKPIQVLLVEDNPTDALLARESLSSRDEFHVAVSSRLQDAVRVLERDTIDGVLLDLGLPDSQGISTLERMRDAAECPIVVLTGNENEEVGIQALHFGAQDYLVKRDVIGVEVSRAVRFAIERNRLARALRDSEERHRRLLEVMPDAVFVNTDNRVTYANPAFARLIGAKSPDELVGRYPLDFIKPEYHEVIHSRLSQLHTGELTVLPPLEDELIRFDGAVVPVEVVAAVISHQGLRSILVMLHDLRRRKELEADRKQLEDQLRQSQKMEAIGRLAGGVAHDFNNLLTVIAGYSEILLGMPEATEVIREPVQAIAEAGERAASLTRQLLAFSRQSMLQPKVLDLNSVVSDTAKLIGRLIGEDIRLRTVFASDLRRVKVDPGQLDQVLINLAVNARDAMPKGGSLTIETSNTEFVDEHSASQLGCRVGKYVQLAMTDNGCGMPPEVRQRIFEPFFTTKSVGKGTGLGLSMVLGIVQQSGGTIHVYSELDRGTTFKIYLPAVEENVTPQAISGNGLELQGSETVLLVEDEAVVRGLALASLKMRGYRVLTAIDGLDALRVAAEHDGPIDLLLTDVVMPNLGGPELAAKIKERYPEIKIIYTSGYTDDTVIRHGLLSAEVSFVQKPYTPQVLAKKVRQTLDE